MTVTAKEANLIACKRRPCLALPHVGLSNKQAGGMRAWNPAATSPDRGAGLRTRRRPGARAPAQAALLCGGGDILGEQGDVALALLVAAVLRVGVGLCKQQGRMSRWYWPLQYRRSP